MQKDANKKRVYLGVLKIAIRETQVQITPKECSEEEKESGAYKDRKPLLLKVAWKELWFVLKESQVDLG